MEPINANDLVSTYVKIRTIRDRIKKEADQRIADLNVDLDVISQHLNTFLQNTGATSVKTPHGTAYTTLKSRFWTDNWDSMYNFIQEHEAFDLLERRLHQSNMKSFLEENPDLLPEGLNVDSKHSVIVRRK
jgi:hypothetical protein